MLAVGHVLIAGYEFGVGNQGIQVPFLQRAIDGSLYARDAMVTTTAGDYPTYFFRLLASPAKAIGVQRLYIILHVLTAFGVLLATAALGRAVFDSRAAGVVAAVLLLAAHHQALGGDGLYSTGFTHTFAVFPLAIAAIVLAYRRWYAIAFLLAGAIFNLHALTAAYVLVLLAASLLALCEYKAATIGRCLRFRRSKSPRFRRSKTATTGRRFIQAGSILRQSLRAIGYALLFTAAAAPTLAMMLRHRQSFGDQWIGLTHLRSADHSFPAVWWQAGSSDVPRFALLAGLFALSLGFAAPSRQRRQTLAMMAAAATLFAIGYLFAEVWPVPLVLRAQLFRCSRLVMILFFVHIAFAAVRAWGLSKRQPGWRTWLEAASAALTVATLAMPGLLPLLPVAFAVAIAAALLSGRLSTLQAAFVGVIVFVCVAAGRGIGFRLIAMPHGMFDHSISLWLGLLVALAAGGLVLFAMRQARLWKWLAGPIAIVVAAVFVLATANHNASAPWIAAQVWARDHSPKDAVFLTPIQPGGFRLRSGRAVVGEWRDGTQLYFSAAFAPAWWQRMTDLQPGLLTDASGRKVLATGRPLASLDDEAIVALAGKYSATHVVLPTGGSRELPVVYENQAYTVYLPRLRVAEAPSDAPDKVRWQNDERFMRETVLPNIEKHRKGNVRLQLLNSDGRPLAGAVLDVRQTRQAFAFSASLPFFGNPAVKSATSDYHPPPVQQAELDRFGDIFNASMIPYSGKWMYLEPAEGQRHYEELDRYVNWCVANGVRIEYHFLSGYAGPWMKPKPPAAQAEAFLRHAREIALRYGDKIEAWQVVNEKILLQHSPAVFHELRKIMPSAQLGISDCAKFFPESKGPRKEQRHDMGRGIEEIRWLREQGVKVDFFGFHGHRPFGAWPEASAMYAALDLFMKEGVRVHITEFAVPENKPVLGPLRGGTFTPDVQAEFYERFYTICYSHPGVDLINMWGIGPNTWQSGSGLLDAQYNPKPAFHALKKLIAQTWRTNAQLTLGLDGIAGFRGFHGDYQATVKLATGENLQLNFSIKNDDKDRMIRLKISPDGKFEPAP